MELHVVLPGSNVPGVIMTGIQRGITVGPPSDTFCHAGDVRVTAEVFPESTCTTVASCTFSRGEGEDDITVPASVRPCRASCSR